MRTKLSFTPLLIISTITVVSLFLLKNMFPTQFDNSNTEQETENINVNNFSFTEKQYNPGTYKQSYSQSDFSGSYLGQLITSEIPIFMENYIVVETPYFSFLTHPDIIHYDKLITDPNRYVFSSEELSNTLAYAKAESEIRVSASSFSKVVDYEIEVVPQFLPRKYLDKKEVIAFGFDAVELTFTVTDQKGLIHVLIVPINDTVFIFTSHSEASEASSGDYMIGSVTLAENI